MRAQSIRSSIYLESGDVGDWRMCKEAVPSHRLIHAVHAVAELRRIERRSWPFERLFSDWGSGYLMIQGAQLPVKAAELLTFFASSPSYGLTYDRSTPPFFALLNAAVEYSAKFSERQTSMVGRGVHSQSILCFFTNASTLGNQSQHLQRGPSFLDGKTWCMLRRRMAHFSNVILSDNKILAASSSP